MRCNSFVLMLVFGCGFFSYAEETTPALTGAWSGRWTDSRPAYNGSGGDFSCVAVEKQAQVWTCTFKLGEAHKWVVELKGKPDGKELRFTGAYKLDDTHGVYFLKASLNEKGEFSGTYSGPDEEGTFVMARKDTK